MEIPQLVVIRAIAEMAEMGTEFRERTDGLDDKKKR